MKRLTEEQRLRLIQIAKAGVRHRVNRARSKLLKQAANARRIIETDHARKKFEAVHGLRTTEESARIPIMIPEVLSLRDNHVETVAAIMAIRDTVLKKSTPMFLHFEKLRVLEPAATLLLVSEIFRCRQLRPWKGGHAVTGNYPQERDVFENLREMGFFRLLSVGDQHQPAARKRDPNRPYFIKFETMSTVHPELAADFADFVSAEIMSIEDLAKVRMVAALKEAMQNAHEHAYELKGDYDVLRRRWWLAGYVHPTRKEMMIMFWDQGVGIPRTLAPAIFERIKSLKNATWTPSDGNMIAAATEIHRTSTGAGGRGRGFEDMKRFVNTCDEGELRVLSNRGSYTYTKSSEDILDYTDSIGGTLVEWRIRHSEKLAVNDD